MNIGERIKRYRKEAGLTQKELSETVNLTPQVISNIERNYTSVSAEDLAIIAKVLGVSSSDLNDEKKNSSTPSINDDLYDNDLAEFLERNQGSMSYGGEDLSEEDLEKLDVALRIVFDKYRKKK